MSPSIRSSSAPTTAPKPCATRCWLAIDDQLRAGNIISDGEMQRSISTSAFTNISKASNRCRALASGAPAHDQRNKYACIAPLKRARAGPRRGVSPATRIHERAGQDAHPGPFTLAGCIQGGDVYKNRDEITAALLPIVNREMQQLATGVDFIQLDEPSFACHPTGLPRPKGERVGGGG